MVTPSDPNGQQFTLPGQAPLAHVLPSFVWPGASFLVFMENVADSSQSRVKMVNDTVECDSSAYSEAVPVVQNMSGIEQPIRAYLTANPFKRMFCFFELPTSLPVAVNEVLPSLSLIVDDAFIEHMMLGWSRGLASNLILYDVAPGELAQAFLVEEVAGSHKHFLRARSFPPHAGLLAPQTAASYIQRTAAAPLKAVSVLPSPVNGATHFVGVSVAEDETQLGIGAKYVLCYVGSSSDTTRVFNQIGRSLSIMDIILSLDKEARPLGDEAATSKEINAMVQASLTGAVSCIATTRTFDRALVAAELAGDYATSMPPDFVPVFEEAQVLGRALDVPVPRAWTCGSLWVRIEASLQSAASIQRMPLGVAPQVYVWCKHSKSQVVFPEDGNGVAISLGVLAAPNFGYVSLGSPLTQVVLARNVSFPTLAVLWSELGFPAYYYDEVAFTITPTLPDGLDISAQNGDLLAVFEA
ncbi:agaA33 [Symbiodinium natans]|uniref:AgaA33 protein n=1 Tax=Symbiodinium natans TaxID=878477 RepID=A0A812PUK3_9DINO|nr:agaA33 [Symbiodinium natans]